MLFYGGVYPRKHLKLHIMKIKNHNEGSSLLSIMLAFSRSDLLWVLFIIDCIICYKNGSISLIVICKRIQRDSKGFNDKNMANMFYIVAICHFKLVQVLITMMVDDIPLIPKCYEKYKNKICYWRGLFTWWSIHIITYFYIN